MGAQLNSSNNPLVQPVGNLPAEDVFFGQSQAMQLVREKMHRVASANVPVLVCGESGTGKDIVARMIHRISPWSGGPFVKINCPGIPSTLLESELFGYEQGAFTGANGSKPGWVELAHKGTLFLDEISELDPPLQAKLLQLLQDGQFSRIGAQQDTAVDVRIVCATNRDLQREIESGRFREDLFYRINVIKVEMPPLRERLADIAPLITYFLRFYNEKYNCRAKPLSPNLLKSCEKYHWPGNVRQLENLIRRYVILGSEEAIAGELIVRQRPSIIVNQEMTADTHISLKKLTREAVRQVERTMIPKALEAHHWNRKKAARALSISYRALLYKVREVGLPNKRQSFPLPKPADAETDTTREEASEPLKASRAGTAGLD